MGRIDKPLERIGSAIRLMHGEERHAIVAPAVIPREGRHRHQFDMRDAEILEIIKLVDRRVERAFRSERSHVQFVDHRTGERRRLKPGIGPRKRTLIVHA